ncbi:MAG: DUF2236 domain-containing protein [Chrysiogenetes bacterium]|nr:DUF2236 domain-containing protein [Chrysiogenetes bacterium]
MPSATTPWLEPLAVVNEQNIVDRDRFETALEKIRTRVKKPEQGLFGPDSMMWRVFGDQAGSIGALRAVLLQTAHPFIAHAVQQKSAYQTDPYGRGKRTIRAVNHWIFGDMEMALNAARIVWSVHTRITGEIANDVGPYEKGDAYAANEQHALFWVHATTLEGPLHVYESIYGKLSRAERERFNDESKLFALLFGIDEALIPPTFADFQQYMQTMFDSEVVTPDAASRDIAKYLLAPKGKNDGAAMAWAKIMTAGLMPPRIRAGYAFPWGWRQAAIYNASLKAMALTVPRLPAELRGTRPYRRSMHEALGTRPGRLEKRLNRAIDRGIGGGKKRAAA